MAKALARQANSTDHTTVDFFNRSAHVSARLGDLIFCSILSNTNTPEAKSDDLRQHVFDRWDGRAICYLGPTTAMAGE